MDAEKFDLWFQGKVLFHKFMTDIGNTGDTAPVYYPSPDANTFPMHDIMRMASVRHWHEVLVTSGSWLDVFNGDIVRKMIFTALFVFLPLLFCSSYVLLVFISQDRFSH